jgi:hypothetical protein
MVGWNSYQLSEWLVINALYGITVRCKCTTCEKRTILRLNEAIRDQHGNPCHCVFPTLILCLLCFLDLFTSQRWYQPEPAHIIDDLEMGCYNFKAGPSLKDRMELPFQLNVTRGSTWSFEITNKTVHKVRMIDSSAYQWGWMAGD